MKKVSLLVTMNQYDFLKSNGGISKTLRRGIQLAQRKRKFHVEFSRANKSAYAYFDLTAKDLPDLFSQTNAIILQLDKSAARIKETFWYLYEIREKEASA